MIAYQGHQGQCLTFIRLELGLRSSVAAWAFFSFLCPPLSSNLMFYIHRFTDKRCELKLFVIPYLRGLNDIITEDTDFRRTYVDDKSMYTSGNS